MQNSKHSQIASTPQHPAIIVLSAKNEERLKEQAQQLLVAIEEWQFADARLADMAYTLQVGREAMEERLGMIVSSVGELAEKLQGFLEGWERVEDFHRGQVKRSNETLAVFAADEDMNQAIRAWINKRKYGKLLDLWVKGLILDWTSLYGDSKPRRISLPTYPFARERYWVPKVESNSMGSATATATRTAFIHPLLQQNTSDFWEQRFSSTFTGREFFLADHVINGQRILPGVAYLEMVRAAVEQAAGELREEQAGLQLKNTVWVRPVAIREQPLTVHIGLCPEDNGDIAYEVYSRPETADAEPVVYSRGSAALSPPAEAPALDLKALLAECSQNSFSSSQCYEAFKTVGFAYGPGLQGIEKVYAGQGQVLARLSLPAALADTKDRFVLHPSLLDAALQASLMLNPGEVKPALPFALQKLEIFGKCTAAMWALVRYSGGNQAGDKAPKLDIDLCDGQGNICVRLKGLSLRGLADEADAAETGTNTGTLLLHPCWQ
uniref:polyketide synthase dehydratase domain-containing protein n=1 Tax=Methylomusa anaerophila TaxID=1930071 RepID=UPI002C385DCD